MIARTRLPQLDAGALARALREDPGPLLPGHTLGSPVPIPFVSGERNMASVGVGVSMGH